MRRLLPLLALLPAAVHAAPATPIHLQALTPSSGTGAESVLGPAGPGWTPAGDPRDEGLLFRFERATAIDSIRLTPCAGAVLSIILWVDGAEVSSAKVREGGATLAFPGAGSAVRSVFLRITGGHGCLAGVAFARGGRTLPVRPPRNPRSGITSAAAKRGKAIPDGPLVPLLHRQWVQACYGGVTRHLKLRGNRTFSWYEAREEGEGRGTEEVLGGDFVPGPPAGPWARIELDGRRQRIERTWRPRDVAAEEAAPPLAGQIELARLADLGPDRWKALYAEWKAGAAADRLACVEDPGAAFEQLVQRDAIVVRGALLQDLLIAAE